MTVYDEYIARRNELAAKLVVPKEADQGILMLKSAGCKVLEAAVPERYFTFTDEKTGKLGFSELMVNMLMQMAYEAGRKDIDKKSYGLGWNDAMSDVRKRLGFDEED